MSISYICPFCRKAFLDSISGALSCMACHRSFPVKDRIADFSEGKYFDSFAPGQSLTPEQEEGLANETQGAVSRIRDFYLPLLARGRRGKGHRVLDSGCGNGLSVDVLCEAGVDAWGVDLSALRKWQWRERLHRDRLACADSQRLPFADGTFDAILCSGVLEHVGVRELGGERYEVAPLSDRDAARIRFLAEHARVLAPEGALWLDFPNGAFPIDFWHGPVPGAPRWHRRNEGFLPTIPELRHLIASLPGHWRVQVVSPRRRLQFRQVGRRWWGRVLAPAAAVYMAALGAVPILRESAANPFLVARISRTLAR